MAKNKTTGLDYEKIEKEVNKFKDTLKNRKTVKGSDDEESHHLGIIEQAHLALDTSVDQMLINLVLCRAICEHCEELDTE